MGIAALAEETSTVTIETIMPILEAVTAQFSIAQIVAIIAGILGVTMAFVFLWWGVRKGYKSIVKAATRGKGGV